jgi:tRNA A-37 threonylcarbamoyl transferase component Bud32
LGEFIANLHESGILHKDLYAANLLVRLDDPGRPTLHLIDLHAVALGRSMPWSKSRGNLVMLNRWFALHAGRVDRYRFWKAYCGRRTRASQARQPPDTAWTAEGHGSPACDRARELEKLTWRSNSLFWERRKGRCLSTNRHYYQFRCPGGAGHAVRDLEMTTATNLFAAPDAPFARPGARLIKDSPSSTVTTLDLPVNGRVSRVIYKRFRVVHKTDPFTALLRATPALRSWINGHTLRDRALPTPRPLAMFHRMVGGLCREGYIVTELVPDAIDLHGWMARLDALVPHQRQANLRDQIDQAAALVRELHRRRVSHRDLKAHNLLVADGLLWIIDLVGVHSVRKLGRARRVQNLARLHTSFCRNPALTRTDKLRFLRVYLQWGLRRRHGWKRWWSEIEKATQDKMARNLRRGRPLS